MTFEDSGTGRELKKPIPSIREREGNEKKTFPKFGNGKGMKKSIPKIWEREGNEKNPFPKFGNGNQRPPFLSMTGNGNSRSPLTPFDDFGQRLITCPKTQFFLVVCCLLTGLRVASSFPHSDHRNESPISASSYKVLDFTLQSCRKVTVPK